MHLIDEILKMIRYIRAYHMITQILLEEKSVLAMSLTHFQHFIASSVHSG